MHALIDLDIVQYEYGNAKDEDNNPLDLKYVLARVDDRISGILEATKASSYQGFLTSKDKSNFRYKVATIKPYKGHRAEEKPLYFQEIRQYLLEKYKAVEVFGMEADDALGIYQCSTQDILDRTNLITTKEYSDRQTIICSLDKDLNMIPGWHYNWRTKSAIHGAESRRNGETYFQDELSALKCFYSQLLTGDSTDNILGLYGVGPKSALVSRVCESSTELDMYSVVREAYEQRFGRYWWDFLLENAQLLWIKREDNQPPQYEIINRVEDIDDEYLRIRKTTEHRVQ